MDSPTTFLQVEIAEVGRLVFSGLCSKLVAPAAFGEVCILPRHAPFLTRLRPGEVRIRTDGGEDQFFFLSGGYLEVRDSTASVLADQMLRSSEIDRQAALDAKQRAEEVLRESHLFTERDPAKLDLVKAIAQLQVLEHAELHRLKRSLPSVPKSF
jgi:F-type H+-transporting ATPase subunit epsilon